MTQITPWRSRLESLFSKPPFEDWMRDAFEEGRLPANLGETFPRADVAETEDEYLISIELPGMKEEDIEVKLTGDQLLISGERKQETKTDDKRFHRVECSYGAFRRTFELPAWAKKDPESIHAKFENGMLEIRIAKVEPQPVAKIPVTSN